MINNYIRLSFTNMKQAVIGTEVSKLLLSPYLITECMLVKEEVKKKELPLVALHTAVMACFDGVGCHLHGYEEVSCVMCCDVL